jgi:hypothetical protein
MNVSKKMILLLSVLILIIGCSSDSSTISKTDYLEIIVNGKTYKENFFHSGTGFSGQTGCVSKPHFLAFMSDIENSDFYLSSEILHLQNEIDFKNSLVGTYKVVNSSSNLACNLGLKLSFSDKTQIIQSTQIQSSGINNVTNISKGNSTSTETEYIVIGNFTSSFKNNSNAIIPITGKYQITIVVLK